MSVFVSRVDRTGIDWPQIGEWKRGMGVNRLETFAKNLVINENLQTDLLNSVPTPWARLLLFEAALYDLDHPAHADVVDQWRGLLGTIALAELLRLPFNSPIHLDLKEIPARSEIRNAFIQLRPQHIVNGHDEEQDNWHKFEMISVDNVVIGATSPRTLVFTGISHRSPSSIPFRSPEGRLADPLRYYEKFGDTLFLKLLAQWLDVLIDRARNDEALRTLLGTVPVSYGQTTARREQLVEALEEWREEFPVETPARFTWQQPQHSPFNGPYSILRHIPRVPGAGLDQSDLFLAERRDVLVCYNSNSNATLVNRNGTQIRDGGIRIYDGHWITPNQPLPSQITFLPQQVRIIDDPAAFFEDALIQAPLNSDTSHSLVLDNIHYLLPYRKDILDYFSPEEIVRNTSLQREKANHLTVTLTIPLGSSRAIRVSRNYREDDAVVLSSQYIPDALAFWPDTMCRGLGGADNPSRYFYYKLNKGGVSRLEFQPLVPPATERTMPSRSWMETAEPLVGFVGTVDNRKGLLLIKYKELNPPNQNWKVSIDLGSTHTRALCLPVERQGDRWLAVDGSAISPVKITPKVKELTPCPGDDLMQNFFPFASATRNPVIEEFVSQIVLPQPNNENYPTWLPREGCIYQRPLLEGFPTAIEFRHNFKWNSDTSDYALRAFLRCLLVMVQSQALSEGARVVSVSHSYPSVFTSALVQKHNNEWQGLGGYSGLPIEEPLSEAEAVGRYLQVGENAAITENTVALDMGGSTTDVAIWTSNKLSKQVSVKMAAGIAGRYVQTEPGALRQRLVTILAGQPFNMSLELDYFKDREAGFSLMFNAILNSAAAKGHLRALITSIQRSAEGQLLIAHIMYVFGALVYYVGLLSRNLNMSEASQFYMFYCGKGGQLFEWIENRDRFVEDMFGGGLLGAHHAGGKRIAVNVASTSMPKQEVGRGLLAESALKAAENNREGGLVNLLPPTVVVGEEGYVGLSTFDELDGKVLGALPPEVPAYQDLKELTNFVKTFVNSASTRDAAKLLGVTATEPPDFRARLKERLFGVARGRVVYDLVHHPSEALLESLFITEVKVLLESVTRNHRLFT